MQVVRVWGSSFSLQLSWWCGDRCAARAALSPKVRTLAELWKLGLCKTSCQRLGLHIHDQARIIKALLWDCFIETEEKDSLPPLSCYKDLNLGLSAFIFPAMWERPFRGNIEFANIQGVTAPRCGESKQQSNNSDAVQGLPHLVHPVLPADTSQGRLCDRFLFHLEIILAYLSDFILITKILIRRNQGNQSQREEG